MDKIYSKPSAEGIKSALAEAEAREEIRKEFMPLLSKASYDASNKLLVFELNNGLIVSVDPALCEEASEVPERELQDIKVSPSGRFFYWDESGAGGLIHEILGGRFGSRKWMEKLHAEKGIPLGLWKADEERWSEWGRMAGSAKSEAKTKAARENGKKGGRPRKNKPPQLERTAYSA